LRILGLGKQASEPIQAGVYLLTPTKPALLPLPVAATTVVARPGLVLQRSEAASASLLSDLRADKGMEWMPASMWLTYLRIDSKAGQLTYDLATDLSPRHAPSTVAAGVTSPPVPFSERTSFTPIVIGIALALATAIGAVALRLARVPR
jgi:hypothetical protein